jgi:hypothetical protein
MNPEVKKIGNKLFDKVELSSVKVELAFDFSTIIKQTDEALKGTSSATDKLNKAAATYIEAKKSFDKFQNVPSTYQKNVDAYKALTHKSGFLVSGSRVQDGMLEIMIDESNQSNLKNLKVEISNVSPSFYDYNYFYSNAAENPGSLLNPAIAAFNIKTDMAYGSFSALNTTEKLIPVK